MSQCDFCLTLSSPVLPILLETFPPPSVRACECVCVCVSVCVLCVCVCVSVCLFVCWDLRTVVLHDTFICWAFAKHTAAVTLLPVTCTEGPVS